MTVKSKQDPTTPGEWITTFLSPHLIEALDKFRFADNSRMSRAEALRIAFQDWCVGSGYISLNERDRDLH
jgi:hypothetical protein